MAVNGSIFAQTNIGGYYFDAFLDIKHSSTLNITEHKVESGGVIADHAYMLPREISMSIAVSDATINPVTSFTGEGNSRSINAYKLLQKLQKERTPLDVFTKFDTYKNCLIRDLSTQDSADTVESLFVNLTLTEVPMAYLETSKISIDWQTTEETRDGILESMSATEAQADTLMFRQWMGTENYGIWGIQYGGGAE